MARGTWYDRVMNRFAALMGPLSMIASPVGFGAGCPAPNQASGITDGVAASDISDVSTAPEASIAEQLGITSYVGKINPTQESTDGDVTTYVFDPQEGPVCMRGAPFRTSVRDLPGQDDLVIFLQGGGACWSEFCLAVTAAPPGVPEMDILNTSLPENPTRSWDVLYLPYCDGSFFAGDAEHDDNLNGNGKRQHRGLANLTGALEVAALRFPEARRILLAGSSGGAYGLLLGAPLVRHYFPEAELIVMADSGIGLARQDDDGFLQTILTEFNLERFLPPDCPSCTAGGHMTGVVSWFLDRDENSRVALFSSWYDSVLANTFLKVPPAAFADALLAQTDALHERHPDRFRRFIVDGVQHTCLLANATGIIGEDINAVELPPDALSSLLGGGLEIGGLGTTIIDDMTVGEWLEAFIANDREAWSDRLAPRGSPPAED